MRGERVALTPGTGGRKHRENLPNMHSVSRQADKADTDTSPDMHQIGRVRPFIMLAEDAVTGYGLSEQRDHEFGKKESGTGEQESLRFGQKPFQWASFSANVYSFCSESP